MRCSLLTEELHCSISRIALIRKCFSAVTARLIYKGISRFKENKKKKREDGSEDGINLLYYAYVYLCERKYQITNVLNIPGKLV